MNQIQVNFTKNTGKMKPMHAVNNGPVYKFTVDQRITNIDAFREAEIPYARTHDAAFYASYGGEHTVDMLAIFPDFDKDVNDPASYDFTLTDEYLKVMVFAGVKPFYRLGSKIEHWPKKYGTLPPKDNQKWAEICEHIIRHYTEGWADGFNYDIEYWEIWNEPDGAPDDADYVDKKCWGGTMREFFELYRVAATHLKKCFPHLKIGGPALTVAITDWTKAFFDFVKENNVPMDFFSWHCYANHPGIDLKIESEVRELLDFYGFTKTESILNEWNYVRSFCGDDWLYSLKAEKGLKGASFTTAVMCGSQYRPLDMLMYYDARPCAMNGLFATDYVCDRLKGYYPFRMFNALVKCGMSVEATSDYEPLYVCAAKEQAENGKMAVLVTHFDENDAAEAKSVKITLADMDITEPMKISYYILDETHDEELVREEIVTGKTAAAYLTLPNFTTYLIKIEKAEL